MFDVNRETVEAIKREYPVGTRVELVAMNDPYARILPGTGGTVHSVDDLGTVHVNWDSGEHLGLVHGEDVWKKL